LQVVQHVRATQGPAARLFAVGFSAGSNCLAKYVGEMGKQCPLTAAASVANAFDIRLGLAYVQKHARLLDRCDIRRFLQ
jgi:predicted alpha/beta-fold hydrolase